jgi:hypothetical protein
MLVSIPGWRAGEQTYEEGGHSNSGSDCESRRHCGGLEGCVVDGQLYAALSSSCWLQGELVVTRFSPLSLNRSIRHTATKFTGDGKFWAHGPIDMDFPGLSDVRFSVSQSETT